MKIDRNKLNTLLRSGLNPEIKTRKHLAAHLNLDPTTLTRWFANRDRLGNPRYPVVPDRHVTKILQLFNLSPEKLNLNDEAFRHYCFENALSHTNQKNDLEQKNRVRLENASQRQLNINDYPINRGKRPFLVFSSTILLLIAGVTIFNQFYFSELKSVETEMVENDIKCWTGYSSSLGDFDKEDKADPCHYGKLFHKALMQLKSDNNSLELSIPLNEDSAHQDYITFLFQQLEHRRVMDNIRLNIELGKRELHRSNYQQAQSYFSNASDMLRSLPEPKPKMLAEISTYTAKIARKLN